MPPQWHALCNANAAITCTTQQMRIDQACEAIKIIEGGLGWLRSSSQPNLLVLIRFIEI